MTVGFHAVQAAGGLAQFNPLTIPWAAAYWTRGPVFQALGLSNGAAVSSWPDETGHGLHLVQATSTNQPSHVASDAPLGGGPVVRCDGTNDFMAVTFSAVAQPYTLVAVCRIRTAGVTGSIFGRGVSASGPARGLYHGSTNVYDLGSASVGLVGPASDTSPHIVFGFLSSTSSSITRDTTVVTGNADTGNISANNIGGRTSADYLAIDYVFVGRLSRALTATEQANLVVWSSLNYNTEAAGGFGADVGLTWMLTGAL